MGRIVHKNFDRPDEIRPFSRGVGHMTRVGPLALGRAVLEPGWRWSVDMKPIVGTASCEIHHLQVLLAGRCAVQMDDGESAEFEPGDVFEVPPGHDFWVVGPDPVTILDVLGNSWTFGLPASHDRVVLTLLMTDIVGSTATAERLGDAAWKQLLANHNRVVRAQLQRFRGTEVNTTGDGFLATFQGAVTGVRCAAAVRDGVASLGIEIRTAVHTGEVEVLPDDVGGIAVHTVARMMALAGPSEVIVSAMTRTLVEGSGLQFKDRGRHQLKGLESPMELFALER